jgi:hypothetical protein
MPRRSVGSQNRRRRQCCEQNQQCEAQDRHEPGCSGVPVNAA